MLLKILNLLNLLNLLKMFYKMCTELCTVLISTIVNTIRAYVYCGQRQNRTADPLFFRQVLYRLSYLASVAGTTGFEPATSCVTGRRELQTSPRPRKLKV